MAYYEEASPICRGKNLSWETVLLFYNNMPRTALPKATFHSYVESRINGWTQTHSQIARQLAFYYEQDGICYPRFTKETTYSDLFLYMQNWASKYFVPNPYAPSLKAYEPVCLYLFLKNSIEAGNTDFDATLDSIFGVKLSSHDKVNVYLSNFTNIVIDDNHNMSINNRIDFPEVKQDVLNDYVSDVKKYFDYFTIKTKQDKNKVNIASSSRQIIYYGAPGTGKSHKIKERLESENVPKENIFRTTFHPDSDYSTFVGAYKPTRGQKPLYGLNGSNTVRLHNNGEDLTEEVITYKFVQQAFLKAYIRAYEKPTENIYLIIEEINRGNCAQIFGDLFQLLDRDENGKSDYTIKADDDLKNLLEEEFNRLGIGNDGIADGELCLPGNLYIYATMNTSDQSLFPIDSAFKRRWDWEYEPIKYNHELQIKIEGETYKWTSFQSEVNKRIKDATSSEDKMLGDYFVNPSDGVIDEHTLRNKILFYLWNDVCKDGEGDIFKTSETEDISFSELYGEEGVNKLIRMMGYLKVETYNESEISKTFGEDEENASNDAKEWRRSFWSDVQVQYKNHGVDFKTNPTDRLYYQMGVGVVYMNFINAVNKQNGNCWVGVYFEAKRADELYRKMLAHKKEIDEKAPFDLEWIPNSAEHGYASIRVTKEWGNLDNPSNRTAAIKWFAERGASILKAIEPFIEELK